MIENITSSIKIYRTKFTGNLEELQKLVIPKLEEKVFTEEYTKNNLVTNGCISFSVDGPWGSQEGSHLDKWDEFLDFLFFLKPHIEQYAKLLDVSPEKVTITNMWANKYPQTSFIQEHAHIIYKNLHSIVFYIKKPLDSGDLFIKDTDNTDYKITSTEGDLIIFPSKFVHYTSPNNSTENKYIIGIDIHCSNDSLEYDLDVIKNSFPNSY